jgi:hypothetical protein
MVEAVDIPVDPFNLLKYKEEFWLSPSFRQTFPRRIASPEAAGSGRRVR